MARVVSQKSIEEEHDPDYVLTAKPGDKVTKRWFVKNEGSIQWPAKVQIVCLENKAKVFVPAIDFQLSPGESMELSVSIKIESVNISNHVQIFVFRFYDEKYGYFGQPLYATVEVTPSEVSQDKAIELIFEGEGAEAQAQI